MVTLPTPISLGQRNPQPTQSVSSPDRRIMQLPAQAEEAQGAELQSIGKQLNDADTKLDQARAKSFYLQQNLKAINGFDNDPDYSTYKKRYTEQMKDVQNQAGAMIKDPMQRQLFEGEISVETARGLENVQKQAQRKEADISVANLYQTISDNREASLAAPDEATKSALISANGDMINASVGKGYLTAVQGFELKRRTVEDQALANLSTLDPYQQVKVLSGKDKTSTWADYIPGDKRLDLLDRAQRQIDTIRNKEVDNFIKDPAALAEGNGADMSNPHDVIAKQFIQQPDGSKIAVQPNNLSVIPNKQAAFLAENINGINNADTMVATLKQIEDKYGSYYPIAMKDLKKNNLSPDAAFISYMDPVLDKHIIDAAFAIDAAGAKKGEGIKVVQDMARTRAAEQNDKFANIDQKVSSNIRDTTEAMMNEGIPADEVNNIQTRASNIAAYFYTKGGKINDAAKQATDWINAKYQLAEVNGKHLRVPYKSPDGVSMYDKNQVENGLEDVLKTIKPEDITSVNAIGSSKFMMENLKNRGYFTLNNDETAYVLRDEFGIPVRGADKVHVFQVPIQEAVDRNFSSLKKKTNKASEENVKFLQEAP